MAVYKWVTTVSQGAYPPTGTLPPWYTPDGIPKALARVPSPVGNGDVLVRTRVAGYIGIYMADSTWYPDAMVSQYWSLIGEVGSSSSLPPDPFLAGTNDFAFTGDLDMSWQLAPFGAPVDTFPLIVRASTRGYQEGHAERGPASYGGVAPSFNLGIVGLQDFRLDPTLHSLQSYWAFTVRCLWRVP